MATGAPQYAQEHVQMCEKHNLTVDIICEDCVVFICKQCAKTDHLEHDWNTISTAANIRRRELKKYLCKVKEEDLKVIEENIQDATQQMERNQKCCDSEVSKFQIQYDNIVSKLDEIKDKCEKTMRNIMDGKNAEVSRKKTNLERKKEQIMDLMDFLEDKQRTMSDFSLLDNLRDMTNLISNLDCEILKEYFPARCRIGNICEGLLTSMMGKTVYIDDINATRTLSFKYKEKGIPLLEVTNDYTCIVSELDSGCIELVNTRNEIKEKFEINVNGVCVTNNGDIYASDDENNSIVLLSPSGSVSTVFSVAPLIPGGLCQSEKGGLLVTLRDKESERYRPDSESRRLVRHVTLTGDVIREYEFQEDGQTRLFTVPFKVKQNSNSDICVVNGATRTKCELVILSISGSLKAIYRGRKPANRLINCYITDLVCDSYSNIIVSDMNSSQIHLLSSVGEFMKYLLTENEVTKPWSMSLYKSNLWIGNGKGLVKIFQYKT